jgi:hypothetical protein
MLHGTGVVIAVLLMIPSGHQAAPCCINAFHPYGAIQVVTVCSPFLVRQKMEHWKMKEKIVEAIQRSSLTQSLHLKFDFSQQGASSSGIPPQGADSIRQPWEAEKTTRGRDSSVVRNLPLIPIKVISLGASSSGIHHTELAVLENLLRKVTYNM